MKKHYEPIYFHLADILRKERQKRNLSQLELAALTGIKRTTITAMENGNSRVMIHDLLVFAKAFNLQIHDLLPIDYIKAESLLKEQK